MDLQEARHGMTAYELGVETESLQDYPNSGNPFQRRHTWTGVALLVEAKAPRADLKSSTRIGNGKGTSIV
jgi:hypothetical protein